MSDEVTNNAGELNDFAAKLSSALRSSTKHRKASLKANLASYQILKEMVVQESLLLLLSLDRIKPNY